MHFRLVIIKYNVIRYKKWNQNINVNRNHVPSIFSDKYSTTNGSLVMETLQVDASTDNGKGKSPWLQAHRVQPHIL